MYREEDNVEVSVYILENHYKSKKTVVKTRFSWLQCWLKRMKENTSKVP